MHEVFYTITYAKNVESGKVFEGSAAIYKVYYLLIFARYLRALYKVRAELPCDFVRLR